MTHLLALGHRRIGFINGAARPHLSQTREDVYREKILEAGLPLDEDLIAALWLYDGQWLY